MKLVTKVTSGVLYTIELTQEELNTVVAAVGISSRTGRDRILQREGASCQAQVEDDVELYTKLREIAGFSED